MWAAAEGKVQRVCQSAAASPSVRQPGCLSVYVYLCVGLCVCVFGVFVCVQLLCAF